MAKPLYFGIGVLLVVLGYFLWGYAVPWIAFKWGILPYVTQTYPLRSFAALTYFFGGVLVVAGITERWSLRIFFWLLIIVIMFLWLHHSLPFTLSSLKK
jgi:hypothetical protein